MCECMNVGSGYEFWGKIAKKGDQCGFEMARLAFEQLRTRSLARKHIRYIKRGPFSLQYGGISRLTDSPNHRMKVPMKGKDGIPSSLEK